MIEGIAALRVLSQERTDEIVITHMSTGADWSHVTTNGELDMHLSGAMGKASSFGLGVALAQPNVKVWVLDGDGSLLMNLGSLVTIAAAGAKNLVHIIYENDSYDTTGGQAIPGVGLFDFVSIAKGCGYPNAFIFEHLEDLQNRIKEVLTLSGPTLLVLKVPSGPSRGPAGLPKTAESFARLHQLLAKRSGQAT